jgi:hypothetical protein
MATHSSILRGAIMRLLFTFVCFAGMMISLCHAEDTKPDWKPLFDGKTLTNWSVPVYGGDGKVSVQDGKFVIGRGDLMTGIRYEKDFPNIYYEIRYEARRTEGNDFFAACTFPVRKDHCTLINGGWGGGLTGLSSVDSMDASENETSTHFNYKDLVWYRFRIQVTEQQIQVWITPQGKDGKWEKEQSLIDLQTEEKKFSIRYEMEKYKPLGFCTWSSEGQIRNIEYRKIEK